MADKVPVKAIFSGSDVVALGEFEAGDTIPIAQGGTGATTAEAARAALGIASGASSFRNKLRNGNFEVNLRKVSGTVTLAAFAYGHDGFKAGAGGCTYTFSKSANKTTLTITAGTLLQIVDGAKLQSGTYTIGYDGTAPVRLNGGAWGTSGMIDTTVVGGVNQTIEWGVGTLSLVQYEPGTVRTMFEFRDDEQQRCLWYLRRLNERLVYFGPSSNGVTQYVSVSFPSMRQAPTASGVTSAGNANFNPSIVGTTHEDYVRFDAIANSTSASAVMYAGCLLSAEQ